MAIHPVIMCGGAGTRLWPISRGDCPKQFHRLVSRHSLFQETVLRFAGAEGFHPAPVIVSNAAWAGLVAEQLAEIGVAPAAILLEPEGRNTAAVAAIAARYLADIFSDDAGPDHGGPDHGGPDHEGHDALGLLVPSDHFIGRPEILRAAILDAAPVALDGFITLFGLAPCRPDTGFGYIRAGENLGGGVARVAAFTEKPDDAAAAAFLAAGSHSWNAGIFLFRPRTMLAELARYAPAVLEHATAALALARAEGACIHLDPAAFARLPATSLDRAVMAHSPRAAVLAPVDCAWSDIGTWATVGEVSTHESGRAPVLIEAENCRVHAPGGQIVALVGVEGLVVVADGNRILVTTPARAQDVGAVVAALKARDLTDFL